jgi:hypothetical protein
LCIAQRQLLALGLIEVPVFGFVMPKKLTPGTPAPRSAQYRNNATGYEITAIKGKPLPPTQGKGQTYTVVDPTKHKSGT